jgi:hypothetical protein
MTLFYVSSLLLIAEHGDNSFGYWYLHAQKLLSYDNVEFVHESSAENHGIWMIYINHIESESFCSGVVKISERYWKRYFSNWLDWLSSETLQWVFWWMQHVLSQVHLLEVFQEQDIFRTSIITRIFPMTHPTMFTLMTMASLWFVDFSLKSSSVNAIGTLAHSGRAAGPSLLIVSQI